MSDARDQESRAERGSGLGGIAEQRCGPFIGQNIINITQGD